MDTRNHTSCIGQEGVAAAGNEFVVPSAIGPRSATNVLWRWGTMGLDLQSREFAERGESSDSGLKPLKLTRYERQGLLTFIRNSSLLDYGRN